VFALLRRVLGYRVSVEALIEVALWCALPYVLIGLIWAFLHPDQVDRLEAGWVRVFPVGADIIALVETAALWPALLVAPGLCMH